jgi:rhamnose transport system permease protein
LRREWTALIFVVLVALAVGLKEPRFFQPQSIESVLLWMPLITVAAMGQLLVVVTGGIDISIGSILAFSGIGVGLIYKANPNLPVFLALGLGLLLGLVLGFVNAALVTWGKLSPLIVTIGTMATFRGLTFLLSKGDQIDSSVLPDSLTGLAHTGPHIASVTISWLLIISLLFAAATAAFLKVTLLGRNVFAYGSNSQAAFLRGISGNAVTLTVYCVCGALSGLAGVMYAARFGFVNPGSAGQNFELTVIAAVAIGGTKLTGGSGSVAGVLLGCLLLSVINVALSVLGIDANWQMLSYGVVILVAILVDGFASRRRTA